ncbi:hypothetical protein GBZ86_04255, partial [Clostridium tarantellae]|nr:hypothetical protein [Clostridium tarantellae]
MNIVDFLLILVFISSLIFALLKKFNIKRAHSEIKEIGKYLSLFIAILLTFYIFNSFPILDKCMSILVVEFGDIIEKTNSLPHIVLIITFSLITACFYFITKQLLKIIDYLTIKPFMIKLNKNSRK